MNYKQKRIDNGTVITDKVEQRVLIDKRELERAILSAYKKSDMPEEWRNGVRWVYQFVHEAPAEEGGAR